MIEDWIDSDEDLVEEILKANRIEAFAAIRRAATYAREMDAKAETLTFDERWECTDFAKGARAAIRAAIGSEKAS